MRTAAAIAEYPMLTAIERDRRYAMLRSWMSRDGLDALVIFGSARDGWDGYISNEPNRAVAFLGLTGEPTVIGGYPFARLDPSGSSYERWVTDVRQGAPGAVLRGLLSEHGLGESSVIGVVGLSSLGFGQWAGTIPVSTWAGVLEALPRVQFVDVSADFERLIMVKSPAEREMVRTAAQIGEFACAAFIDAARVGVREAEIAGAAIGATIAAGGWCIDPVICFRAGRDRFSWGRPEWIGMGGGGRVLQQGDSAAAELFSFYGNFETQQQIEVSLGEPDALVRRLEEVCVDSYTRGLALIREPGATFAELSEVMMEPIRQAGYWNTGPQVHGIGPCWPNTPTHVGMADDPAFAGIASLPPLRPIDGDVVIAPGMSFAFEPNAIHEFRRVCIGGTVMVTEDGVEELNTLAKSIHVV